MERLGNARVRSVGCRSAVPRCPVRVVGTDCLGILPSKPTMNLGWATLDTPDEADVLAQAARCDPERVRDQSEPRHEEEGEREEEEEQPVGQRSGEDPAVEQLAGGVGLVGERRDMLVEDRVSPTPPKNRDEEAAKARARAELRYAAR